MNFIPLSCESSLSLYHGTFAEIKQADVLIHMESH